MNEFRGALADSARLLMPRAEAEQLIKALTIKTDSLEARTNSRDDRGSGQAEGWTKIGLAVSIAANFVMIFVYLTRGHA
jgi:hypothetical protein